MRSPGELAVREAAETGHDGDEPVLIFAVHQLLARRAVGAPLGRHKGEIVDEKVGDGAEVLSAPRTIPVGAFLGVVVGCRAMSVAGTGAVQVLAPQQELDGVIAGGDIGLHAPGLL
jgi:hypothetical protein